MTPFKDHVSVASVTAVADDLSSAWPAFPKGAFIERATSNLASMELKARVAHVADALAGTLPKDWPLATDLLIAVSGPIATGDGGSLSLWPLLSVVERHGLHDPLTSLAALRELTRRFSAEFAIRPFLIHHPEITWEVLDRWVDDPCRHVRRLCSEGTRPRLPWGAHLRDAIADPGRGLRLIERLNDDPSGYVRRSVANHLNDVCKDHPDLAVSTGRRWLEEATPERQRTVRHGLRTLLKAGAPDALALFGWDGGDLDLLDLRVEPSRARVGESVEVSAQILPRGADSVPVRVDLDHEGPGVRGRVSRTWRGPSATVEPGMAWAMRYRLSLASTSTRTVRSGVHRVTVRVNGTALGTAEWIVEPE